MFPAVFPRWVALAAAVALVPRLGGAQPSAPDGRPTMAVLYFTNAAMVDREEYAPLAKGLAEMVITELAGNPGVRVVERDRIQALFDEQALSAGGRVDPETAVKAGKTLGARHLLFGTFVVDPRQTMRMDVRAINTETSALEVFQAQMRKAPKVVAFGEHAGNERTNEPTDLQSAEAIRKAAVEFQEAERKGGREVPFELAVQHVVNQSKSN